jgi:hypothetical protein
MSEIRMENKIRGKYGKSNVGTSYVISGLILVKQPPWFTGTFTAANYEMKLYDWFIT